MEVVSFARGKYMIFSDCSFLMVSLMGPLGTFLDGYLFGGVMITLNLQSAIAAETCRELSGS